MAIVATDHGSSSEIDGFAVSLERSSELRLRQECAAVVRSMAVSALGVASTRGVVVMGTDPGRADRVHAVRATGLGGRDRVMADATLGYFRCVALHLGAVDVVVWTDGRVLGVGGTVAIGAVETAVSGAEAEEALAGCGYVRGRREGCVRSGAPDAR